MLLEKEIPLNDRILRTLSPSTKPSGMTVTGIARQNISDRRYNKKEILPVTNGLGPVFRKVVKFNTVFEITTC